MNLRIILNQKITFLMLILVMSFCAFGFVNACQEKQAPRDKFREGWFLTRYNRDVQKGHDLMQEALMQMTPKEKFALGLNMGNSKRDWQKGLELIQESFKEGIDIKDINTFLFEAIDKWRYFDDHYDTSELAFIHSAIKEIIKLLLSANANPNATFREYYMGNTPLMNAIHTDREIVELLLAAGGNPNIKNQRGNTSLNEALRSKNKKELLKLLLDFNADPNIQNDEGNTALFDAAYLDDKEAVRLFLDHDADIEIKNKEGRNAIQQMRSKASISDNEQEIAAMIKDEPQRRIKRKELIQKEAGEYLPSVLAYEVSDYFSPSSSSTTKSEKRKR